MNSLTIEHLVQMARCTNETETNNYNLNILTSILPFSLSTAINYNIYFNYCENITTYENGVLFPYYIILEDVLLIQLSSDMEKCIMYTIPEYIEYFSDSFHQIIGKSKRLVNFHPDFHSLIKHALSCLVKTEQFSWLAYQPCLPVLLDEKQGTIYINRELPDWEDNLELIFEMTSCLKIQKSFFWVFSPEGLDSFMNTGELTGTPYGMFLPLSLKDRLVVAKRLREAMVLYPDKIRMLNPSLFSFPDFVSFFVSPDYGVDYFLYQKNREFHSVFISENSLSWAFKDFITGISSSSFLYPSEKALEIIDQSVLERV